MAQTDTSTINALSEYAACIGFAFQIKDDILDVTANAETLGKTPGKDIAQDKVTSVDLLGLDGAEALCDDLIHEAKNHLAPLSIDTQYLDGLADLIGNRKN